MCCAIALKLKCTEPKAQGMCLQNGGEVMMSPSSVAACELDIVLQKALLEGVRLPHEFQWDKSPLLWGTDERSQNVISLVISRGVHRDSLVAQTVKNLPAMWEVQVGSLEKEMTTHSSMLAWKIPWMEEPGGLQSIASQRVRHDWLTSLQEFANFRELWLFMASLWRTTDWRL